MKNVQEISPIAVEDQTSQHDIASTDISANSEARQNGNVSIGNRKLFVGGIHHDTGVRELRDHFGKYGEIEEMELKTDHATQTSRGFTFIIFKSSDALNKVQAAGDHIINGKKVDSQKANTQPGKIYVRGLSADLKDEDIKTHFAQFGTIVEAHMPFDKLKKQRRSFCFIVFESEKIVRNLLKIPVHKIKDKYVELKRAGTKKHKQPDGVMMVGRGSRGGLIDVRGVTEGYEMQGVAQGNFNGNNEQASSYRGMSRSMMRGRGGRGDGIRGARSGFAGGGGSGMQGFNEGFGNYGHYGAYDGYAAYRGGYGQWYQPY